MEVFSQSFYWTKRNKIRWDRYEGGNRCGGDQLEKILDCVLMQDKLIKIFSSLNCVLYVNES
jgi:hypothetical protein